MRFAACHSCTCSCLTSLHCMRRFSGELMTLHSPRRFDLRSGCREADTGEHASCTVACLFHLHSAPISRIVHAHSSHCDAFHMTCSCPPHSPRCCPHQPYTAPLRGDNVVLGRDGLLEHADKSCGLGGTPQVGTPHRITAPPLKTPQFVPFLLTVCPLGTQKNFAVSRGAVGPGATAHAQVRTYFCLPIFIVSACTIVALRVE